MAGRRISMVADGWLLASMTAARWLPAAAATGGGGLAVLPAARAGCWLAIDVIGLSWGLESLAALSLALALTVAAAAACAGLVHRLQCLVPGRWGSF